MSGVVAHLFPVDHGNEHLERNVALPFDPFPGDTLELADGLVVRITRRRLVEVASSRTDVDVHLGVREEKSNGF